MVETRQNFVNLVYSSLGSWKPAYASSISLVFFGNLLHSRSQYFGFFKIYISLK